MASMGSEMVRMDSNAQLS